MKRLSDVDYIVDDNDCWIWQLGIKGGGYGQKWDKERKKCVSAHKWYYEQLLGPVPTGMDLDHLCRVRRCVNPDHLEPVSRKENLRRGPRVSGDHCKRGHLRTEKSTIVSKTGSKRCRICYNAYMADYYHRKVKAV